ncbi:MAG TPA: tetrahydrofolate dehydrogenase/cyclohydrolase catalytic domain-containing protein [Candidatus Woesebacteria bacterium]|nr:tetrahydrofolate dehydrogenase/cyclohydrolase catalytic domain-containing protein [Candidatus Woesebacteria bacterium]
MRIVLNGKKEAEKIALFLEESERLLGKSLLIIQCDGHAEESTYVRLKREMGERLGVLVSVVFGQNKEEVETLIKGANDDETVDGILVQLPIIGAEKEETEHILSTINPEKDIDGLNPKSRFIPAAVRAVERVMDIFKISKVDTIAVVGSKGSVGKRLMERFEKLGFVSKGFDKGDNLKEIKEYTVVVGTTGSEGLIKEEMVREGFVGIDLGYPKGDLAPESVAKADMVTPVPGGVGPLTIVCLYENLAEV